ncbi:hypothetical protein [Roseofilum casamattae]|uniref:Alpha/beta hydrolase n=1 Tax=Roseofilum casamattae BLCC-M143 TaxID=3022442 RepID=A0ABT7C1T7_9CYAN|nr:hypothetical protein [Roseofilum casamattae]MDJ1185032.1 hypothetical protein [Roseofilum casamattae BLCC-M143]
MAVLICPGFHDRDLTESFLTDLALPVDPLVPPSSILPIDGISLFNWMREALLNGDREKPDIAIIGYSAGVVGAMAVAAMWHHGGGRVRCLIAIDGWGVALAGPFPIHRISHDYFTHWSSALLGVGERGFYAEPAVEHLQVWRSPDSVTGYARVGDRQPAQWQQTTAKDFIRQLLSS